MTDGTDCDPAGSERPGRGWGDGDHRASHKGAQPIACDGAGTTLRPSRPFRADHHRRVRYRRAAAGLSLLGIGAALTGLLFPGAREVFFALTGAGFFLAVLTLYLVPEASVPVPVAEHIFARSAALQADGLPSINPELGRLYVPNASSGRTYSAVSLALPDSEGTFRALTVSPLGEGLLTEAREHWQGGLPSEPEQLAEALADVAVNVFGLADSATVTYNSTTRTVTATTEGAFEPATAHDHPFGSLLAAGLATEFGVAVRLRVKTEQNTQHFQFTWPADEDIQGMVS